MVPLVGNICTICTNLIANGTIGKEIVANGLKMVIPLVPMVTNVTSHWYHCVIGRPSKHRTHASCTSRSFSQPTLNCSCFIQILLWIQKYTDFLGFQENYTVSNLTPKSRLSLLYPHIVMLTLTDSRLSF